VQALHVLVALEALVGPGLHKGGAALRHFLHTLLLDEGSDGGGRLGARLHCLVPGLEKTRVFKKEPAQWVYLFNFFCVFLFFCFFYIFAQKREFLGFFSVSRILLGASRLCS
jgi:hypothetical protein